MKIGIISDTHGILPAKIFDLFKDVDCILHAGDIGNTYILTELECIANTYAVYGNTDNYDVRIITKKIRELKFEGFKIHLSHYETPDTTQFDIIVRGHTHLIENEYKNNCLFLNPGTASGFRCNSVDGASALILYLQKNEKPKLKKLSNII